MRRIRGDGTLVRYALCGKRNGMSQSAKERARRDPKQNGFAAGTLQLVDQLRRDAPGQQTGNRLEQSQHDRGVIYIAIRAIMDAMYSSTIQLNKKHQRYHQTSLRRLEKGRAEGEFIKSLETLDREYQPRFDAARRKGTDSFLALSREYDSKFDRLEVFHFKALPTAHAQSQDEQFRPFDDPDHSLVKLLDTPNRTETFNELLAQLVLQYQLTGQGLLWANGDNIGIPRELYVLPTALCYAQPPMPDYPEGWWRVTQYYPMGGFGILPSPLSGGGAPVDGRDVFVFKNPHPLWRFDAYSPLDAGAIQLDILESIDQARWTAMDMGLTPDMILLAPGVNQDQLDAYLERLKHTNIGKRNHRKVMAIGGDQGDSKFDVKFPSTTAKDMDFSGGWDQMTAFALALFGVPKSVAGLATTGSYAELYAAIKQFHTLTLRPLVARLGAWLTRHLARIWGDDLAIQLDLPTIDDQQLQEQQLGTDLAHDGVTYNEYRAIRGRKPVPGGDVLCSVYVQLQQSKAQQSQQAAQPQPAAPGGGDQQPPNAGDPNSSSPNGFSASPPQAAAAVGQPAPGAQPDQRSTQGDPLSTLLGNSQPGAGDEHVQNATADAALGALGVPSATETQEKFYESFVKKARPRGFGKPPTLPGKRASGAGGPPPTPAAPVKAKTPPTEERGDAPATSEANTKVGEKNREPGEVYPAPLTGAPRQQTQSDTSAPAPSPKPAATPQNPNGQTPTEVARSVKPKPFVRATPIVPLSSKTSAPGTPQAVAIQPPPVPTSSGTNPIPASPHQYKVGDTQVAPEHADQVADALKSGHNEIKLYSQSGGSPHAITDGASLQRYLAAGGSLPPDTANRVSVLKPPPIPGVAPRPDELPTLPAFDRVGQTPNARIQPQAMSLALTANPPVRTPGQLPPARVQPIAPKEEIAATVTAGQVPHEDHFKPAAASVPADTPAAQSVLQNAQQWASSVAAKHVDRVAAHFNIPPEQAQRLLTHAILSVAKHAAGRAAASPGDSPQAASATLTQKSTGQNLTVGFDPRRHHEARKIVNDMISHLSGGHELKDADAAALVSAHEHLPQEEQQQAVNSLLRNSTHKDTSEAQDLMKHVEREAGKLSPPNEAAASSGQKNLAAPTSAQPLPGQANLMPPVPAPKSSLAEPPSAAREPLHRTAAAALAGGMLGAHDATAGTPAIPSPEPAQPAMVASAPAHPVPGHELEPPATPSPVHNPDVHEVDEHGITKAARVGVPADQIPDRIPVLPNLTARERRVETKFREKYEQNPDRMANQFGEVVREKAKKDNDVPTFGTDDAKVLSKHWAPPMPPMPSDNTPPEVKQRYQEALHERSKNRATLNLALHQTANAIAKRAFVKHLDTLKPGDKVMITNGGVASGKGYGLSKDDSGNPRVPRAYALKQQAKAVWDSAGDQNATENKWIQEELEKRGLKGLYVYTSADPNESWTNKKRGVVKRAGDQNDGRMVDAHVFADSYVKGAQNFDAFSKLHKSNPNAEFVYIRNGENPQELPGVPESDLKLDRHDLLTHAIKTLHESDAPEHVKHGGSVGARIWGSPGETVRQSRNLGSAPPVSVPGAPAGAEGHRASVPAPTVPRQQADIGSSAPTGQQLESGELGAHLHPNVQIRTVNGKKWVVKGRANNSRAAHNEALASSLAQIAGVDVPEVHHVKIHGQDAAAVEHIPGAALSSMKPEERRAALAKTPKEDIDHHALFDYLIGSSDPNNGNYLLSPNGKLTAIDKEKSLSQGVKNRSHYQIPFFLADATPSGTAGDYQFHPKSLAQMAQSGEEMAQHLRKLGRIPDARGVLRRTEVLKNLAKSGRPVSAVALRDAGMSYDKSSPLSLSERLKSAFGF